MCGVIGTPKSHEQLVSILLLNKMNKCICLIDKNVLEFLLKCTCLPVLNKRDVCFMMKSCRSNGNVKKITEFV